jgi:uncharacterized Zn finger protein (UPF0148 family)
MNQTLENAPTIVCPSCGHVMKLVRAIPRLAALPEVLLFSCPSCNQVETKEAKRVSVVTSASVPPSSPSSLESRAY